MDTSGLKSIRRILASHFPKYQNQTVNYIGLVQPDCFEGVDGSRIANCVDRQYIGHWVEVTAQVVGNTLASPTSVIPLGNIDPPIVLKCVEMMHDERYAQYCTV